jgi:dihydroneopterin aldolase
MTIMQKINSSLCIHHLELYVHLGWQEAERAQAQGVALDIDIHFAAPPAACVSDRLDDTLCYSQLIQTIREYVANKQYQLLEHFGFDLYQLIKKHMPEGAELKIALTKHPHIEGLTGGVSFCYQDKKA